MEIVNRYVAIQKIRYEERLDFRVSVPPQFRRCRIPKFTIQPLLENAIQYALEPKLEPCTIRLYARREDKGIRLTVEDNGPGMDEQLLDKLRNGEIHTRGKGIGLMNIDERIKLSFGEEYGLSITSHPGQGTKIGVLLPGDREGHHVQSAVGG